MEIVRSDEELGQKARLRLFEQKLISRGREWE